MPDNFLGQKECYDIVDKSAEMQSIPNGENHLASDR